jgi:translation initiation factor IF-2
LEKQKRRVYQVAKEKKLSSDALISMLKGLDFEVKSHMSVVDDKMFEAIGRKIEEETKSSINEVKRQKEKEAASRKKTDSAAGARPRPQGNRPQEQRSSRPSSNDRSPADRPGRDTSRPGGASSAGRPARSGSPTTSSSGGPASGGAPPVKDETRRKRRGKRDGEVREGAQASSPDRKDASNDKKKIESLASGDLGGRWRAGGAGGAGGGRNKRRKVDSQAVQDNVRKTLSQLNETKGRRRYSSNRRDDIDGEGDGEEQKFITVSEFITVGELAEQVGARPAEVIATCLGLGTVVSINQRLDMDTITMVADEFGFEVKPLEADEEVEIEEDFLDEEEGGDPVPRSPVVTVMGHVDHGKTSLLDYLRKTDVVAGESGGITQHIGAYVVHTSQGNAVTFLDTPGHAAFTAMRARGARVTDLVILIVAADDNVMPQTIEAIDHAKAAQVPIVVAINKVDLPTADPDRIKRELSERGLLVEDWGGKVAAVEISATTGQGIEKLIESVLLEAEILELKAIPERRARGTIVEAQLDKGRGPVATVLIQEGTLKPGDPFVTGIYSGRVRALFDEHMVRVKEAGPSTPVQVLGLSGVPQAGDTFRVTSTEREAKDLSQRRQILKREQDLRQVRGVTLSDLQFQIQEGKIKDLNVIVKGDVDGSVEAINQELGSIVHDEVRVAVIRSGVGPISESDVLLATASKAIIIGFNVGPDAPGKELASREGVDIHLYSIIYEVIEEIRAALTGMLAPEISENVVGAARVRQVFRSSRAGSIAGVIVEKGKFTRNNRVRIVRAGETLFTGPLSSLRRFKDDVREVLEGFECGMSVDGFEDIIEDDVFEALETVEAARTL